MNTLYIVSSLENWPGIMYITMDGDYKEYVLSAHANYSLLLGTNQKRFLNHLLVLRHIPYDRIVFPD